MLSAPPQAMGLSDKQQNLLAKKALDARVPVLGHFNRLTLPLNRHCPHPIGRPLDRDGNKNKVAVYKQDDGDYI